MSSISQDLNVYAHGIVTQKGGETIGCIGVSLLDPSQGKVEISEQLPKDAVPMTESTAGYYAILKAVESCPYYGPVQVVVWTQNELCATTLSMHYSRGGLSFTPSNDVLLRKIVSAVRSRRELPFSFVYINPEQVQGLTSAAALARASLPVVEESASAAEEDKEQAKTTKEEAKPSESSPGTGESENTTSAEAAGESTTRKPHPLIR